MDEFFLAIAFVERKTSVSGGCRQQKNRPAGRHSYMPIDGLLIEHTATAIATATAQPLSLSLVLMVKPVRCSYKLHISPDRSAQFTPALQVPVRFRFI
jgi:hypothetical protein